MNSDGISKLADFFFSTKRSFAIKACNRSLPTTDTIARHPKRSSYACLTITVVVEISENSRFRDGCIWAIRLSEEILGFRPEDVGTRIVSGLH